MPESARRSIWLGLGLGVGLGLTWPLSIPLPYAGKKALALQARSEYAKMYKAYCRQPKPEVPSVCSSSLVKSF